MCGSGNKWGSLPRHIPILGIYVSPPPPRLAPCCCGVSHDVEHNLCYIMTFVFIITLVLCYDGR